MSDAVEYEYWPEDDPDFPVGLIGVFSTGTDECGLMASCEVEFPKATPNKSKPNWIAERSVGVESSWKVSVALVGGTSKGKIEWKVLCKAWHTTECDKEDKGPGKWIDLKEVNQATIMKKKTDNIFKDLEHPGPHFDRLSLRYKVPGPAKALLQIWCVHERYIKKGEHDPVSGDYVEPPASETRVGETPTRREPPSKEKPKPDEKKTDNGKKKPSDQDFVP